MSQTSSKADMQELSKLQRQIVRQIARHVRDNNLPPGTQLTEIGLAELFGVSRSPVRAALDFLALNGAMDSAARRGFTISNRSEAFDAFDVDEESEVDTLYLRIASDFMSDRLGDHFSEADLMRRYDVSRSFLLRVLQRMARDFVIERSQGHGWRFAQLVKSAEAHDASYRFRMLVEPAAILEPGYELDRRWAERSRAAHEAILNMDPSKISPIRFFEMNSDFHELIAAGSHNSFFLQAVQQQNRLRRFIDYDWGYGAERMRQNCQEHLEMLAALEKRDLEWASMLMRRHLDLAAQTKLVLSSEPE